MTFVIGRTEHYVRSNFSRDRNGKIFGNDTNRSNRRANNSPSSSVAWLVRPRPDSSNSSILTRLRDPGDPSSRSKEKLLPNCSIAGKFRLLNTNGSLNQSRLQIIRPRDRNLAKRRSGPGQISDPRRCETAARAPGSWRMPFNSLWTKHVAQCNALSSQPAN